MCKQQASNKSLIIGWLTLDPWIIYTLGGESEERCRFRAELFSRPPREYFHLSPFTVMIWKQPWQLPQRQMFPCMESEDAESSELLQANEQFSGEGQTFTLSPRLVSSAPGGGCLLLRTPGLNLRQWPEPSFGCWTIFRLFLEHTLEYWWSNKFVFVNWLRPDPWITNTPDRESRERSKSSHR